MCTEGHHMCTEGHHIRTSFFFFPHKHDGNQCRQAMPDSACFTWTAMELGTGQVRSDALAGSSLNYC